MSEKAPSVTGARSRPRIRKSSSRGTAVSKTKEEEGLQSSANLDAKKLAEENAQLRKELETLKSLYQQLVHEGPAESYEEQRVHLLKSQVIQLERQVILHTEALSKRSLVLLEVENILERITDQFRELLSTEIPGPRVQVERSQLTRLIEDTEGARRRLYRNVEACDPTRLAQPVRFMGDFLKPTGRDEGDVTLLNICSGDIDHLNLKHVAKLESELFSLLKNLLILKNHLKTTLSTVTSLCAVRLPTSVTLQERLDSSLTTLIPQLSECCQHLIQLSILIPSAPWPPLRKSLHPEIASAHVLAALPSMTRSKRKKQAQTVIEALLKANNYAREVNKLEYRACSEELVFHQEVYELQMEYSRALFDALRDAYLLFEEDLRDSICMPLNDILTQFNTLKESSSVEALKSFLSSFKAHSDKLQHSVDSLQPAQTTPNGEAKGSVEALSAYGTNFFNKVDLLVAKYSRRRKELLKQVDEAKQLQKLQLEETLQLLTPSETKQ